MIEQAFECAPGVPRRGARRRDTSALHSGGEQGKRVRRELPTQALARTGEPFVDRTPGAAERAADLVGRKTAEVAQLDALAMRIGEREHGDTDLVVLDFVPIVRAGLGPTRDALALFAPRVAAQQRARRADDVGREQAATRAHRACPRRRLDQLHEDLLDGVFGEVGIACDLLRDREQPGVLAAYQRLEIGARARNQEPLQQIVLHDQRGAVLPFSGRRGGIPARNSGSSA